MEKPIETAMEMLAKRFDNSIKADEALKFSQAALNLAHVLAVRHNIRLQTGEGK